MRCPTCGHGVGVVSPRECVACEITRGAKRAASRPIVGMVGGRVAELVDEYTVKLRERPPRGVGKDGRELESTIMAAIMLQANRMPRVQIYRNNVGKTPMPCGSCRNKLCNSCGPRLARPVTYGLCVGSSDLIGSVGVLVHGIGTSGEWMPWTVAIEVKRPGGKASAEQIEFIEYVRSALNWKATVVDNVADAIAFVGRVQRFEE